MNILYMNKQTKKYSSYKVVFKIAKCEIVPSTQFPIWLFAKAIKSDKISINLTIYI